MNALASAAATLVQSLANTVNAAWTLISPPGGVIEDGMEWGMGLNEWLPISDFLLIVGVISGCVAFSMAVKWGIKVIDWVRG